MQRMGRKQRCVFHQGLSWIALVTSGDVLHTFMDNFIYSVGLCTMLRLHSSFSTRGVLRRFHVYIFIVLFLLFVFQHLKKEGNDKDVNMSSSIHMDRSGQQFKPMRLINNRFPPSLAILLIANGIWLSLHQTCCNSLPRLRWRDYRLWLNRLHFSAPYL